MNNTNSFVIINRMHFLFKSTKLSLYVEIQKTPKETKMKFTAIYTILLTFQLVPGIHGSEA